MKRIAFFVLISALLASLLCGCKKSKPASTVRIAIQPSAAFIPLYVARYNGLVEQALAADNVQVVWQDFESGPPMNESLAADMSDIGVIGDVPTVSALAGATPMKLVGIPASGPDAYAMLALKTNNSFNSSEDMKGKKIATVFGSTGHNFTTKLLAKNGLSFEDIEFISISAGDVKDALISGLADAVVIWEPNVTRLIDSGVAKVVALGEETDLQGTNGFVVRSEYLIEHHDVIVKILEQYNNAVNMIPKLDDATLDKLSIALNLTPEQIKSVSAKYDYSVSIKQNDIESLQDTVNFLVEIGNLGQQYTVSAKVEQLIQ